ncbi:4-(cytidine 5'-diphospho)-2-C-methyl-D-erythritol kinase [Nocardioides hwasunensis]|uniref:4-diphosphocytidyl-2-C-methyl-D-erythritol kinase n=1 Tax=Nocardioides hwasunensis TaxID=397258 RepID=A0ABR8MLJ1_9ACTN|nr:4-(cytidine 5'-diphospho)-2-C-methyl-D-erythritol kinase [Nocardioides hwasunensis]MBD3915389.1 4-(cytidine 5'-diphospho)-2-C-methyl-D-erythritol kinase [Nocardioides hwasunensis]
MTHDLTVRAPAKINLHLGVGRVRDDGFHPLDTVYQALSIYDDLSVGSAAEVRLSISVADYIDRAGVPDGEDNLVSRAVAAMARHHGRELPVDLVLDKSIPLAGGMAGGSADAAAALLAVDRWHDLRTSDDALLALAAGLGSDVPFSLVGGTARGVGRGEVVVPVEDTGAWWWVAVPSTEGLSTPTVYRHFDTMRPDAPEVPASAEPLLEALASGEPVRLARALHNDLQEPAIDLRPELGDLIVRGEAEGALRGIVSGSGPTVVFLCDSADGATATGRALAGAGHDVVLTATGPVAGVHVVS